MANEPENATSWSTDGGFLPVDSSLSPVRGVGDALYRTSSLFNHNLRAIVLIALPLNLPVSLIREYILSYSIAEVDGILGVLLVMGLLDLLIDCLVSPAIVYAVVKNMKTGEVASVGEALAWGMKRWGATAGYLVLASVIVILGLLVLVVPGVIAAVMFALVVPIIAVEGSRAVDPLRRSRELTASQFLTILKAQIVALLILGLLAAILSFPIRVIQVWWLTSILNSAGFVANHFFTVLFLLFYLAAPETATVNVRAAAELTAQP